MLINPRNVSAVRDALSGEFGPVAADDVARHLNDLVKVGAMDWK